MFICVHTCADLNIANQLITRKASDDPAPINANIFFLHSGDGEEGDEARTRKVTPTLGLTLIPRSIVNSIFSAILVDSPSLEVPHDCVSILWVIANEFTGESNIFTKNRNLRTLLDYLWKTTQLNMKFLTVFLSMVCQDLKNVHV